MEKKKTLGRRKIEIKKIEKRSSLQVAFSKRRTGLFKKASELSVLCGAEVAILVQSPADKLFAFGNPALFAGYSNSIIGGGEEVGRRKYEYEKAVEILEMEKRVTVENGGRWWEESIEGMGVHQLEEFLAGLENLRNNVNDRLKLQEMEDDLLRDEEFDKLIESFMANVCRDFDNSGEVSLVESISEDYL